MSKIAPTGEPDAGKPPVRFGGRGGSHPRPYPYPQTLPATVLIGFRSLDLSPSVNLVPPSVLSVSKSECEL